MLEERGLIICKQYPYWVFAYSTGKNLPNMMIVFYGLKISQF